MASPLSILIWSRDLIADPEHWTTGHYATTDDYQPTDPTNPDASRWCAIGSLERISADHGTERSTNQRAMDILHHVAWAMGDGTPADINDRGNHALVMDMFARAIAIADTDRPTSSRPSDPVQH